MGTDEAREHLFAHMGQIYGTLDFYCLDYWHRFSGVDVVAMHGLVKELIRFRPSARAFLKWLSNQPVRVDLVTNAHRGSIAAKDAASGVCDYVDHVVSAHDHGMPKESAGFWERFEAAHPFDAARAVFIDDNENVLNAARDHGVGHVLTIAQPDSARPPRDDLAYPALGDFKELYQGPRG